MNILVADGRLSHLLCKVTGDVVGLKETDSRFTNHVGRGMVAQNPFWWMELISILDVHEGMGDGE